MFVKLNRLTVETEDVRTMHEFVYEPPWWKPWQRRTVYYQVYTAHSGVFNLSEDEFFALLDIMRPRVVEFIDPEEEPEPASEESVPAAE